MGGGLMQLVLNGQMDNYITVDPCINYYKYVYKKHTNFSMETTEYRPINNASAGFFSKDSVKMTYKIERKADLISNMYLSFNIPEIYSNNEQRFRWVENIGYNYVNRVELLIDGKTIETLYSDWMNIWNELTNKDGIAENKLIGNVNELIAPYSFQAKYTLINNKLYNINYPVSSLENNIPSIKSRKIQIPLNFWFTRNPSLALPLLKLANNEITIDVYTNNNGAEGLYKVWCNILNTYVSSKFYNELHNDKISIRHFLKSIDHDVENSLHITYVFLDSIERSKLLLNTNNLDYVIDTIKLTETNIDVITESSKLFDLNCNNHVKEIIWFIRRDDMITKYNNYTNYTASPVYAENMGILKSASIHWAKETKRADNYSAEYYNNIQPYYHHTNIPRTGIYLYSFALFPEKINTSGSYNSAKIKTSLSLATNDYSNNKTFFQMQNLATASKNGSYDYNVKYDVKVFVKEINVLTILNGGAQLKFV